MIMSSSFIPISSGERKRAGCHDTTVKGKVQPLSRYQCFLAPSAQVSTVVPAVCCQTLIAGAMAICAENWTASHRIRPGLNAKIRYLANSQDELKAHSNHSIPNVTVEIRNRSPLNMRRIPNTTRDAEVHYDPGTYMNVTEAGKVIVIVVGSVFTSWSSPWLCSFTSSTPARRSSATAPPSICKRTLTQTSTATSASSPVKIVATVIVFLELLSISNPHVSVEQLDDSTWKGEYNLTTIDIRKALLNPVGGPYLYSDVRHARPRMSSSRGALTSSLGKRMRL
ncbi:hypothetical protein BKA93DRAFT_878634 [Sparassis latifolia]